MKQSTIEKERKKNNMKNLKKICALCMILVLSFSSFVISSAAEGSKDITSKLTLNPADSVAAYTKEAVGSGYKITSTADKGEWACFWFELDGSIRDYTKFEFNFTGTANKNYLLKIEGNGQVEEQKTMTGSKETVVWQPDTTNVKDPEEGAVKLVVFLNPGTAGAGAGMTIESVKAYGNFETPAEKITIKFETNGGAAVDTIETVAGTGVGEMPLTTLEGKLFAGWYTDAALTTPFAATTYNKSMTLYARFVTPEDLSKFNTVSFLEGWVENDTGTYDIAYENGVTKLTTKEAKDEWSFVKTKINGGELASAVLKVTVTGDAGKTMMIKLPGISGKEYEYTITFTGKEQTEYFSLSERVDYEKDALLFVDGGQKVSGTKVAISELSLYGYDVPKTADVFEVMPYIVIMIACASVVVFVSRRKYMYR